MIHPIIRLLAIVIVGVAMFLIPFLIQIILFPHPTMHDLIRYYIVWIIVWLVIIASRFVPHHR